MKIVKMVLLTVIISLNSVLMTGCWNYREINEMAVVAGVAIDQGLEEKYKVTVEIVEVTGGKESKTEAKTISMEGKTIFDAVRNQITLTGKRLYWSHLKTVIISRQIAARGAVPVLDWYNRDAETRGDIHILVSKEETAREIFTGQVMTEDVKSYELDKMLDNQRSLSKAPQTQIWQFTNDMEAKGIDAVLPAVGLKEVDGGKGQNIIGSAVFKGDKLAGFLEGEDTMNMLFVKNQVKGGVLFGDEDGEPGGTPVSLEIFKNKTKTKLEIEDNHIQVKVNTETTVAIDEIGGSENVIDEEGRRKLEQAAEKMLKNRMENIIKKIQIEFGSDVFGFGAKLREDHPEVWKHIGGKWDDAFREVKVKVDTKVNIRNSAMLSKPLEAGE
jgi:spore germination protein KC